jgi:hypothetical protein
MIRANPIAQAIFLEIWRPYSLYLVLEALSLFSQTLPH